MTEAVAHAPSKPGRIAPSTAGGSAVDRRTRIREVAAEFNTAVAHHRADRIEEAEALYRRVLEAIPNHPRVLHFLGLIELQRGCPQPGVELIGRAFPALSRSPEAQVDFGNALRLTGEREEAVAAYRRAVAVKPDYVRAHVSLGGVLTELGRFEAAVTHCQSAVSLDPASVAARTSLATALQRAGRLAEAAQAWREIIDLDPDRAESYHQLALRLAELTLFKEAVHCHDRAIALQPNNAAFHCAHGYSLLRLYDGERATASFRRAAELAPDSKDAWTGLSWALRLVGRFEEADRCAARLREIDPEDLRAVRHVPSTGQSPNEEGEIERLLTVVERAEGSIEDRVTAGFALGRLLDKAGRFDEAFAHYTEVNTLVRRNWPFNGDRFDAESFMRSIDALIDTNTEKSLADAVGSGNVSELPVFVVGMPRSGTTLVEQICASHSRIFGAGELDAIPRIAAALAQPSAAKAGRAEASRRAADRHIVQLHHLGRGALRVVDKMPDNVLLVGLIARLFPRARIIYCSRDPRDTSLSCYFQLFSDGAQYFSYELAACGRRCRQIERLAGHWLRLLPLHMIEVNYENLVRDLEGETRRLIEFLGLDWEPACLDFHRTERTVATISYWQVRQPIYTGSIGRWRSYERHLGRLFAALDGD